MAVPIAARVEEARLFADTDRRRVVIGRDHEAVQQPTEPPDSGIELALAIAEIAAERQGDRNGGAATGRASGCR